MEVIKFFIYPYIINNLLTIINVRNVTKIYKIPKESYEQKEKKFCCAFAVKDRQLFYFIFLTDNNRCY